MISESAEARKGQQFKPEVKVMSRQTGKNYMDNKYLHDFSAVFLYPEA